MLPDTQLALDFDGYWRVEEEALLSLAIVESVRRRGLVGDSYCKNHQRSVYTQPKG
jgi:hypothetical protein